jgi:hypothetical protein
MRYAARRDGEDIGFLTYLDGWLEPELTREWRGIFDVDDIWFPIHRDRLRSLIDESDEIRPNGSVTYEDDAEEVVFRRGTQAHWFKAFMRKLAAEGYTLQPAPSYDDAF